jgi:hypothetical protein
VTAAERTGTAGFTAGFTAGTRDELARLFRRPRLELGIIGLNALTVCAGWVLLPIGLRNWFFSNLHGPLAFVFVLETWMICDVTSTNMFAHDAPAALAALARAGGVRRLVRVKIAALAVVIGPPCLLVALVVGAASGRLATTALVAPVILALPFGAPAVASWLGVVLPYRARSLRWRWRNRRPWARTLRWALLTLVPYWFISAVVTALVLPAIWLGSALTHSRGTHPPPMSAVAVMVPVACLASVAVFLLAPVVSDRLAQALRGRLVSYFQNPDAG